MLNNIQKITYGSFIVLTLGVMIYSIHYQQNKNSDENIEKILINSGYDKIIFPSIMDKLSNDYRCNNQRKYGKSQGMIYNKAFNAEKNGFKIEGVICTDNQGLLILN